MVKDSKPYKMIFQVNWVIWSVLLSSQVFFIVMSLFVLRMDKMINSLGAVAKESYSPASYITIGCVIALISYYFHQLAYKRLVPTPTDAQVLVDCFKRFQMNNMLSWAFAEFITFVGIVSLIFNAPHWVMFSLCLSGFSLHAFYYPRVKQFFELFEKT